MSFSTAEAKSLILSSWDIEVCGHRAFVADCDHKISIVKIYNALNEMPDSVLIGDCLCMVLFYRFVVTL